MNANGSNFINNALWKHINKPNSSSMWQSFTYWEIVPMLLPMFLLSRLKVLSILCFPNHMSRVTLYPRHYWASIKVPLASPRLWIVPMKAEECCMVQIPLLPQRGKWAPCALCPVPGYCPPRPHGTPHSPLASFGPSLFLLLVAQLKGALNSTKPKRVWKTTPQTWIPMSSHFSL